MTWLPHCPHTISIGSYLIGALVPAERAELTVHLRSCRTCRAELICLAGLPGLLARLRRRR